MRLAGLLPWVGKVCGCPEKMCPVAEFLQFIWPEYASWLVV